MKKISFVFIFSTSLCAQDFSIPSVNLPRGHFAYDLIERWETEGILEPSIDYRNLPYTRAMVTQAILSVQKGLDSGRVGLSRSDAQLFVKLKGEFHRELSHLAVQSEEREKNIFYLQSTAQHSVSDAVGDAIFNQTLDITHHKSLSDSLDDIVSYTAVIGRVRGIFMKSIAYYSDFTSTLIKGASGDFTFGQIAQGGNVNFNPSSSNVYSLEANAYVVIQPKWLRVQFGKDYLSFGPARHSNVFLSDNAPPFDHLRVDASFRRLKVTYLHGWLRSTDRPFNDAGKTSDRKFLVAHRLEFRVLPWLFLAGNESVIYGGRAIEAAYLNPLMVYHIAEQYLGDKDNNTIAFDVTAFPWRRIKLYSALFLDDFTSSRNPFRYWKQTWAFQAGLLWVQPFQIRDTDFRFEYSRIEPYVYTHKWGLINYTHFDQSLGSFLPPNSDSYFSEIKYRFSRRIQMRGSYELIRHGRGDLETFGYADGFVDAGNPGKQDKKFLMGVNERKHIVSFNGRWETWNNHYLYGTWQLTMTQNVGNNRGQDQTQHRFLIGYSLDY